MQVKVIKNDTSTENYIHTKVLNTIWNGFNATCHNEIEIAEELSETITYYIYNIRAKHLISSGEIFSMIIAVLSETGFLNTAELLEENHYLRKIKRARLEVVNIDIDSLSKATILKQAAVLGQAEHWDKANIYRWLIEKHKIEPQTARTIASSVEEKIINMDVNCISTGLIKQIVLSETAIFIDAANCLNISTIEKPKQTILEKVYPEFYDDNYNTSHKRILEPILV